jgi:O-antigen biosynthesis protein
VRASRGEVLVFLNNDTILLSGDWLERLAPPALEPTTGAVGALLLFPDGRIQHSGVVLGYGQDAGHFGAFVREGAASWLGRNQVAHETTAVTAACLALERRKFDAVGGFDAEHLAVQFNDIDLCLKLMERGWRARIDPEIRLVHVESASRGKSLLRSGANQGRDGERRYFRNRWRDVIRDDRFFHPGLSLHSRQPALW